MISCLLPAAASAQGFAVRIGPEGLEQLGAVASERLPASFPIEAFEKNLFDCPGSDLVASIPPTAVDFTWHDLTLSAEDGRLSVSLVMDLETNTTATIDNVYACFGTAVCDVSAVAEQISATVQLSPTMTPEGGVDLSNVQVQLGLAADDLEIDSDGCAIGDAAEWLFEAVEGWALERLLGVAETAIATKISELMAGLIDESVGLSVEQGGFAVRGWLDSMDVSATERPDRCGRGRPGGQSAISRGPRSSRGRCRWPGNHIQKPEHIQKNPQYGDRRRHRCVDRPECPGQPGRHAVHHRSWPGLTDHSRHRSDPGPRR